MKILITGGTGFIGKRIGKRLVQKGHSLFVVTRDRKKYEGLLSYPCTLIEWSELEKTLPNLGIDAVIHLVGEGVAEHRWTAKVKKEIYDSRIKTTQKLVHALKNVKIKTFVGASAIGYYGDRGEEILNENSKPSDTFLAQVCIDWEKETSQIKKDHADVRLAMIRVGIVLGEGGGALKQMVPIFQNGIGSELGDGEMWMSWIHVDDLVEMFVWAVENEKAQGIYNGVSPNPVRNADFSKALADIFQKSLFIPPPKLALKTILGEMADVVLGSQNVQPQRALQDGFGFQYFDIEDALRSVVEPLPALEKKVIYEQWVPATIPELFSFFENELNLETITPPSLQFKVTNKSTEKIQKGTLINYRLKLYGVPLHWQTLIEEFVPGQYFIDTQKKGPYQKWHHTHQFETLGNGTVVRDIIRYKISVGLVGRLVAGRFVDKDVEKIFKYRADKIAEIF